MPRHDEIAQLMTREDVVAALKQLTEEEVIREYGCLV